MVSSPFDQSAFHVRRWGHRRARASLACSPVLCCHAAWTPALTLTSVFFLLVRWAVNAENRSDANAKNNNDDNDAFPALWLLLRKVLVEFGVEKCHRNLGGLSGRRPQGAPQGVLPQAKVSYRRYREGQSPESAGSFQPYRSLLQGSNEAVFPGLPYLTYQCLLNLVIKSLMLCWSRWRFLSTW